jgi:hypothetical protein
MKITLEYLFSAWAAFFTEIEHLDQLGWDSSVGQLLIGKKWASGMDLRYGRAETHHIAPRGRLFFFNDRTYCPPVWG